MDNLDIYNRYREVPQEAKREIKGGRLSGFTDINAMWRIKVLTQEFGPCGIGWYYTCTNKWLEKYGEEIAAFADIELYVKIDDEWSKPILGSGGSKFATPESKRVHVSDECYKMAITDAISVACKQLGIGADVYFAQDKSKYGSSCIQEQHITEKQVGILREEIDRVGAKEKAVCFRYKINSLSEMTPSQFCEAITILYEQPDKVDASDVEKNARFE